MSKYLSVKCKGKSGAGSRLKRLHTSKSGKNLGGPCKVKARFNKKHGK